MFPRNTIVAFTDGSCINNGKENAIGGYGAYFPYHEELCFSKKISSEVIATNNIAELLAILESIQRSIFLLEKDYKLLIYTDSKYCYNIFTEWIISWKKNNKQFKNMVLINKIYSYIQKFNYKIQFHHCFSHQKQPQDKSSLEYFIWKGNFEADKLAKHA